VGQVEIQFQNNFYPNFDLCFINGFDENINSGKSSFGVPFTSFYFYFHRIYS
jgi:hypothetical protein